MDTRMWLGRQGRALHWQQHSLKRTSRPCGVGPRPGLTSWQRHLTKEGEGIRQGGGLSTTHIIVQTRPTTTARQGLFVHLFLVLESLFRVEKPNPVTSRQGLQSRVTVPCAFRYARTQFGCCTPSVFAARASQWAHEEFVLT